MRTVNTDKMDKVTYAGQEIAFGRVQKNEYDEYVVKVYVDGVYDEDKTIYADSREDAEYTKAEEIKNYTERSNSMNQYKDETIVAIKKQYGENAQYILKRMEHELEYFDHLVGLEKVPSWSFVDQNQSLDEYKTSSLKWQYKNCLEKAEEIHNAYLTPATAKVGDGATVNLYSDRYAGTIIKVTKKSVTVRRDKATLDPNFKPEFIPGGFAGHCTNQEEQSYTYEADPNGEVYTIFWSDKYNRYGRPGDLSLSRGRHEFYDYNF